MHIRLGALEEDLGNAFLDAWELLDVDRVEGAVDGLESHGWQVHELASFLDSEGSLALVSDVSMHANSETYLYWPTPANDPHGPHPTL